MSDQVIVLSSRPSVIKNIYPIIFEEPKTPMENRNNKEFLEYYQKIWKDIDIHV